MQKKALYGGIGAAAVLLVLAVFLAKRGDTGNWDRIRGQVLPELVPAENKFKIPIVAEEFVPGVDIAYVLDYAKNYNFIYREKLAEWGISEEKLKQQAMRNLEELVKETEIQMARADKAGEQAGNAMYGIIETVDGYAAARILSPRIRRAMADHLSLPFIAAIPVRDFLIFWPTDFAFFDDFEKQIREEFGKAETYALTPNLLKVTAKGVELLED